MHKSGAMGGALIGSNDAAMVLLLGIPGRVRLKELGQAIKHRFCQFFALCLQPCIVRSDREADDSILTHEEVFTVGTGDEAVFVTEFPALFAVAAKVFNRLSASLSSILGIFVFRGGA